MPKDPAPEHDLICQRYEVEPVPMAMDATVGVADNVQPGVWPVNGLRHTPATTSGWFIWAGKERSDADGFFKPLHAAHLYGRCPEVLQYLNLPPGSRFLIAPEYEDVWQDPSLVDEVV